MASRAMRYPSELERDGKRRRHRPSIRADRGAKAHLTQDFAKSPVVSAVSGGGEIEIDNLAALVYGERDGNRFPAHLARPRLRRQREKIGRRQVVTSLTT